MADRSQAQEMPPRTSSRNRPGAAVAAELLVPILLGLLGFCAVAAAVASAGGTMEITLSGLAVVLTLLLAAGTAPRYLPALVEGRLLKPLAVAAAAAGLHLLLSSTAGPTVLISLPAVPVALAGGILLLATSLWSQLRRGPATGVPAIASSWARPGRPFTHTLVLVLANWVFFAAAGMFSAWILLGR